MATLLILLSSIFYKCLSATPLGDWRSGGQASKHHYAGAGSSTACGFYNVDSYLDGVPPHPSHDSAFPFGYVSAVGTVPTGSPFDNLFSPNDVTGQGCGACYEIQCIGIWGDAQEGCVCNAESVVVQAIDLSGQNPEPHFDIAFAGFDVIAGPLCGRVAIDYRQVTCDFTDNIYISTDWNDAWSYYLNFYNVAGDGKLCGVELRSNGVSDWMTCSNIGSKWRCDESALEPTVLPLSFRLTDCAGQVITATDVVTAFGAITADLGVNFVYGGGVSTSSTTTTSTTTTSTTAAPVGGITYPLFVSYIGQIGPNWGDSYNAVLLSNLGVPGYSTHPYNVLHFAFWLSSTNVAALRTAAGSWQNLATFITDTTLRQTLTGSTNPTSAQLRTALKAIYTANNIKLFLSAFGANDDPMTYAASTVGTNLGSYAKAYLYDGVDIDWESGYAFDSVGTGEAWLTALTSALDTELNPTGKSYLISHAPQAPYFMGSTLSQYPRGGYLTVHSNVGPLIDWYNVQFYNQGPSTLYNSYSNMFEASIGWSLNTAVYQMINGDNPESVSIPSSKIVVGKHSLGDGSDFVDGATLKSIFNIALASSPVWNTGFMCWQFYTENTQSPQFQVANAVVAANWDLTVTAAPTAPTATSAPTVSPVPTTANPTGNGGGGGCVSGNICVKVKGFASETPTTVSPVWWWSIYDENIIDSLGGGCAISDCTDIEIKQSSSSVWIAAYDENGDCGFNMGGDPFTSAQISVDVKITSTNGDVIVAAGVVQTTAADTEWDFGSNFGSCTGATANPSNSPTKNPSTTPTATPSANPSSSPMESPTAAPIDSTPTPTKSPANDATTPPTRNPSKNPTGSPTRTPSKNPTSSPNARTSTPTSVTPNPSKPPTKTPTTNPTKTPTGNSAQNDTPNPTKNPTKNPIRQRTKRPTPSRDTSRCIRSCTVEANGDYQSCNGCHVFATCSNGVIYDNRACPADLVFDADLKYCGQTSSTCSDSNAFTSGGGGSGATQSLYIVLSVVAVLIICCGVALSLRCMYKKKRSSKTRRKSQEDLANVIQMNDLASYPGPTHVALPSKSIGLNTNTSTDGSQIGFAANTDSGAMLSVQAPAMKALNMVKSYSVSVYSPELKPVPQPQMASQPQDTDNSFVI